jgi:acetyl esterase/lipase
MFLPALARRLALFAAGFALLTAGVGRADEEPKLKKYAIRKVDDIRYHDGHERQRLDVFAPKGLDGAPVVLFVHGGGWMIGDKNLLGFYRGVGKFLAEHGVVAVLCNYRLSPEVQHPEHVKDVARAFAWTRRHVRDYGGDPDHIFLCGHSAGGHLVALLATDETYLKDPGLKLTDEDRAAIRGVIGVSGVYSIPGRDDFQVIMAEMLNGLMKRAGAKPFPAMLMSSHVAASLKGLNPFQVVFGNDRDVAEKASPVKYVRPGLPPFLLLYAENDLPKLPEMAREFGKALADKGNRVEVKRIDGTDHIMILFTMSRPDDPTAAALLKFIAANSSREKTP